MMPGTARLLRSAAGIGLLTFQAQTGAADYFFEARLTGSDTAAGDVFGTSVAVAGGIAVVGAPSADTGNGVDAGAAYVFAWSGTAWNEAQKLTAPDGAPGRQFGFSVALDGDTLVVGAPSASDYTAGAAYVFVRSGPTFALQQKLVPGAFSLQAGYSVSLAGDTAAVGAPGDASHEGQVFVFARSGSAWSEQPVSAAEPGILPFFPAQFGRSTSVSGDTLIVGELQGHFPDPGVASVYVRSGSVWSYQQGLQTGKNADYFAVSVSVSGDTAVGGTLYDGIQSGDEAYVFVRSGSVWQLQQKIVSPDVQPGDDFGSVVTLRGDGLVLGAPVSGFGNASGPGAGYLFLREGSTWTQSQRFTDPLGGVGDHFGASVAFSGDVIGFGAPVVNAALLFRAVNADVGVTVDDQQAEAVPGTPLSYSIVVSNDGPTFAPATVSDPLPPGVLGASWTCTASAGSFCAPGGSGAISDAAKLLPGGTVTYTLMGILDPAAPAGTLANTATVAVNGDPNPANDSATDTDLVTPVDDLSATLSDGQTTATPGQPLTYAIAVANAGPSTSLTATVFDGVPPELLGAAWTCTAAPGSTCTAAGTGNIDDQVQLAPGGSLAYTLTGTVDPAATLVLVNTVTAHSGADANPGNDSATDQDALPAGFPTNGELVHGYDRWQDLAALPGPVPDQDLFRILQRPHSSYEVLVDGVSGDLGTGSGPFLDLLASDASTVVLSSSPAGAGGSRSLRWANGTDLLVLDQFVRVRSAGCTTDCDASDVYHLTARETTGFVPRFNNSGTQITVLVLENSSDQPLDLDVRFQGLTGAPLGGVATALGPRQTYVLNTSTIAPGTNGSITVAHTGRHGDLSGKAVAVEPATGFTFDTALEVRGH
jgi:uncharacterized repeat protein (TIGR01451 family)